MASRYAVAVLIISPNGIPLIRDPKKPPPIFWKLPGGKSAKAKESAEDSAIREINEELGLILKKEDLEAVYREERENHEFIMFQASIPYSKNLKEKGDEGEEIKLFAFEDLKTLRDFFPPHREILEEIRFFN